jgi:hypothetical protein
MYSALARSTSRRFFFKRSRSLVRGTPLRVAAFARTLSR